MSLNLITSSNRNDVRTSLDNAQIAVGGDVNPIVQYINDSFTPNTVTQATSITTGVTLNSKSGVITTQSTTLAAGASASAFTLTNSTITASSVIITNCEQGATGSSVNALVSSIANGSCNITLTNVGGTTTGAAAIKIHFLVIN
jgi:hypothetical protein